MEGQRCAIYRVLAMYEMELLVSGVPFIDCWHRYEVELLDSGVPFTECWHIFEVEGC